MDKKAYQSPRIDVVVMGCQLLQASNTVKVNSNKEGSQSGAEAPGYYSGWTDTEDEDEEDW